jgi:phage gp36-like protein
MAAPKILEALVKQSPFVEVVFDQALDNTIDVPPSCFSINYGIYPVMSLSYSGTDTVLLELGRGVNPSEKLFISYGPPDDISRALRAPVKPNSSQATIRRNVVRAFFKVSIRNLLKPLEETWYADANLGTYSNGEGYSRRDRGNNPRTATPDDFILAYGLKEAIQLTNIDDADATQPDTERLWMAIQDASALIDSYINQSTKAGKLLISSNRRRTTLIISRYYLDTVRRREDVLKDYERAIKELDASTTHNPAIKPDADLAINSAGGILRSFKVPQRYNSYSGKGLSGWWTDSAGSRTKDWRYDTYNDETNNNESNWGRKKASSEGIIPEQPTDGGDTTLPE